MILVASVDFDLDFVASIVIVVILGVAYLWVFGRRK